MPAPDLSAITSGFFELGGPVMGKKVTEWNLGSLGYEVRTNVTTPQVLSKMFATGAVRPYAEGDNFGTGVKFSDRKLTVNQTKMDYTFNPEEARNKYLAKVIDPNSLAFVPYAVEQVAKEYLDQIMSTALYGGTYNSAGTTTVATMDGLGKIIADEITATNLVPVTTGAITNTNAVSKIDLVAKAVPFWMRQKGFIVKVSYATFDKYAEDYRTKYGFQYTPSVTGGYRIDNVNATMIASPEMGTSSRIICTVQDNLVFGTDINEIGFYPTPHLDLLQIRNKMPVGLQIADLEAIVVNEQV